jgi:hypothetical protein
MKKASAGWIRKGSGKIFEVVSGNEEAFSVYVLSRRKV